MWLDNKKPSVEIPVHQVLFRKYTLQMEWKGKSGDEANATRGGGKNPNLMRYILPCLKNASKAASYYSAVIEQCFQQWKHFYRGRGE